MVRQKAYPTDLSDAEWALLAPWEKDALAQCAIFRGGWDLLAVEAVVDLSAHSEAASLPAIDIGHLSRAVDAVLCKAILGGARMNLRDGIAFEAKCFGEVCGLEDMKIGTQNFLTNGPKAKASFVHR